MNKFKKNLHFIFVIVFLAVSFPSFAQGIKFVHNLDSALTMAKAENKPIFIDFYTSWCAPCKVMSNEVFPQEKVGNFFNKKFINCKIQCDDNGVGVEIGKQYAINAYPTIMFLNANGELIHSAAGSLAADEFIDLANIALNPEKNLMSLIKKWNAGQRDTAFATTYFAALKEAYRTELAKSQLETYLNGLAKNEQFTKNSFNLIKLIGFPPFSPVFSLVESNKKDFYKTVGRPVIDKYLADAYTWYLRGMVMERGAAARQEYFKAKAKFKAKNYPSYDETTMFIEVFETFDTTGKVDIKEYQRRGTAFLNKYGLNNDGYTTSLASLLGNCTGRENEGAEGIVWMENLLVRNKDPRIMNLYFYIVWRNYQFDKALEIGKQIRDNAVSKNESTKEIDNQMAQVVAFKEKVAKKKAAALQAAEKKPAQ